MRKEENMKRKDNIATKLAPVWRTRLISPLTQAAVREEQIESGELQQTPLDKILSTEEADALERYVRCEHILRGHARSTDYTGDRIQGSRSQMSPIADARMKELQSHQRRKEYIGSACISILTAFCMQQWRDAAAKSDAELGLQIDPHAANAANAWRRCVRTAARRLTLSLAELVDTHRP